MLRERLQNHPDVEDIYYPNKYRLPTDFYVYKPPNRQREYTQNVIFDPCRLVIFECWGFAQVSPGARCLTPLTAMPLRRICAVQRLRVQLLQ